MEIYIEYLVLDNMISNACILYATLRMVGRFRLKRVVVGTMVATVIGTVYPLLDLSQLGDFLFKIITSAIIVIFLDFGSNIAEFFKEWILFYIISFILGGLLSAILNTLGIRQTSDGLTFLTILSGLALLGMARALLKILAGFGRTRQDVLLGGKRLTGIWDTGNGLFTHDGRPIHVVSAEVEGISCRPTGRSVEVKTVAGAYYSELYVSDGFTVFGSHSLRQDSAYFVYSKQSLGAIQVVLNEGAKSMVGGEKDEKLFCKAD